MKTRIAIVVALVLGSASAALADGYDFNPKDRWPNPVVNATAPAPHGAMVWTGVSKAEKSQFDRASRTVDGGA